MSAFVSAYFDIVILVHGHEED